MQRSQAESLVICKSTPDRRALISLRSSFTQIPTLKSATFCHPPVQSAFKWHSPWAAYPMGMYLKCFKLFRKSNKQTCKSLHHYSFSAWKTSEQIVQMIFLRIMKSLEARLRGRLEGKASSKWRCGESDIFWWKTSTSLHLWPCWCSPGQRVSELGQSGRDVSPRSRWQTLYERRWKPDGRPQAQLRPSSIKRKNQWLIWRRFKPPFRYWSISGTLQ